MAQLKARWSGDDTTASSAELSEFALGLGRWMQRMGDAVICRVAEVDGLLVGMAWMVLYERAPNLRDPQRLTGDVQSVFVLPDHRKRGIGLALVVALCDAADQRGVSRTTVHGNVEASSLYRRAGFAPTPTLMERDRPDAPEPSR